MFPRRFSDQQKICICITNAENEQVAVYNLTNNDLANSDNFAALKSLLLDAATSEHEPSLDLAAIADVTATEGDADLPISLTNVFNDADEDNASITKTATSSDTALVTVSVSGNTLTLDYQPEQNGTATITVTATSNGQTVDDVFAVTVTVVDLSLIHI